MASPLMVAARTWTQTSTAVRPQPKALVSEVVSLGSSTPAITLPEAAVLPAVLIKNGDATTEVSSEPPLTYPIARSLDGHFVLTDTTLTVLGQRFGLRELERAEVHAVRWVLWVLLGGLGLATVLIAFLQNRLHTLPAVLGVAATALLLVYGYRGTNRLRLWRLGRESAHVALPGELASWQRLVSDLNRRIGRAHDRAAAEAAALLAAAQLAAAATDFDLSPPPPPATRAAPTA